MWVFVDISVVIVMRVVFGWREQGKADKLFWTLTLRSLWGLQMERFWKHLYLRVWSWGDTMKQREKHRARVRSLEKHLEDGERPRSWQKTWEEVAGREYREYDITEAKERKHFKEKGSQQVEHGWEEYSVWTERCPLDSDKDWKVTFRFSLPGGNKPRRDFRSPERGADIRPPYCTKVIFLLSQLRHSSLSLCLVSMSFHLEWCCNFELYTYLRFANLKTHMHTTHL